MILKRTKFVKGKFENYPDIRLSDGVREEIAPGVTVSRNGHVVTLCSDGFIKVNNQASVGERQLASMTVIECGDDIYVFEDEEAEKAFLSLPQKTEEKIERVAASESRYSPISVRAMKQQHCRLFLGDGTALGSLAALSNRLIQYAKIKLKWERAVLLRILGKQGHCIASTGMLTGFRVPKALVFPVWRERKAQRYIREDAESRGLPPTLSIVENHVARAMISPFLVDERIVAILYVDSSSCLIPDASYFLLDHVCSRVSSVMAELLDFPELKEVVL